MSTVYVADAGAMIADLRHEPGGPEFLATVVTPDTTTYAHGANLAEVFYEFHRSDGEEEAQTSLRALLEIGVLFHRAFDRPFWEDAARIKAEYRRVSLADCFGLALARRVGGTFLTTDHHELEAIQAAGVCPIQFIR